MNFSCAACHSLLTQGDKVCKNCGTAFDVPAPNALATPPLTTSQSRTKPIKLLIGCFGGVAVLLMLLIILVIVVTRWSSSPAGKAAMAEQSRDAALHQKQGAVQAAKVQQNKAHPKQAAYRGPFPAIAISPTMTGYDDGIVTNFLNRAYPNCQMTHNEDGSTRHSEVIEYTVTEPSGHKVRAILDFVDDDENYTGLPGRATGHYKITEQPYLTTAQEQAQEQVAKQTTAPDQPVPVTEEQIHANATAMHDVGDDGILVSTTHTIDVAISEKANSDLNDAAAAKDQIGYEKVLLANRAYPVPTGTKAKVIGFGSGLLGISTLHIRLMSGSHLGDDGWVEQLNFQKQ